MRKRHWTKQGEKYRLIVLQRGRCELLLPGCTGIAETVDHDIPKRLGGQDLIENLLAACWSCNGRKGPRTLEEARAALGTVEAPTPFFSDAGYRRDRKSVV